MNRKSRTVRALAGVLGCVCFLAQPLLVPLHLVLVDHASGAEHDDHVHAHVEDHHGNDVDGHRYELVRHSSSQGGHPPHPVEDHVERIDDPAVLPPPLDLPVAAVLEVAAPFDSARPAREGFDRAEKEPRPPPLGSAAAPRAPPFVV